METTHQDRLRRPHKRRYLMLLVAVVGLSLLFSPPSLVPERATGADRAALPDVDTTDRLTIRLAQTLGQGQFTVAARDLGSGETYDFGHDREYDAASTMKLLFAALLYRDAERGLVDLDEVITIPRSQVQRYGTGTIQGGRGPYRYSYRDLARLMMEKSDNTAAFVLSRKLGHDRLQSFAAELGLERTSVERNVTTAKDMTALATAIHERRVAGPETTAQLLDILDASDFEDRLPAKLPAGTDVRHKTGDAFDGGLHDVGIVTANGRSYAVAIFTDQTDAERVKARMADASRDVFAYFHRDD